MTEENLFPPLLDKKVLVTNTSKSSLEIANKLREKNIEVELYVDEKDLDKQLRYADRNEIPFVLMTGENLILKDMKTGEQKEVDGVDQVKDLIA